jgi:hypothetical protein
MTSLRDYESAGSSSPDPSRVPTIRARAHKILESTPERGYVVQRIRGFDPPVRTLSVAEGRWMPLTYIYQLDFSNAQVKVLEVYEHPVPSWILTNRNPP